MTGIDSQVMTEERTAGSIRAEVAPDLDFLQLIAGRTAKIHQYSENRRSWIFDLSEPVKIFRDEQTADNVAEVFLLSEELPVFTQSLISHPILLPTSYSQQLSMEQGIYCLQLKIREPFEDFSARLVKALTALG